MKNKKIFENKFPILSSTPGFFTKEIYDDFKKKDDSLFGGPIINNKGILNQIENSNIISFDKNINSKDIEKITNNIFSVKNRRKGMCENNILFFTGEYGMFNLNWVMTFGQTLSCKFYPHYFKYYKERYISLFEKNGIYKLKTINNNIIILKGTEIIKTFENLVGIFSDDYKKLYGSNFNKILVNTIKNQMNQVNDYLKKLENGIK